ncbi:cilia- and flagella-associated protein 61 isoform X1 [Drosophila pseudoobscura]|uniref:Cilia- and flagella-associated protein 61 isoform X1 n=2 Tax=Drosophila pseudoobscura pseudoobscura TaxID=46245 RepID=A0A6I8UTS7_DROPS|nr:cilia- and flagella-associated protein 61 isoform X1 [Drosophila pseudoobscura]
MAKSTNYVIRMAGIQDLPRIETLYSSSSARHFGEKRRPPLMQLFFEHQAYRLIVYDPNQFTSLLAYCEFNIHPNIPVLANDLWLHWLSARFCLDLPLSLLNSMFLNFFICRNDHPTILIDIIMELFYNEHKVHFLIIAMPPNLQRTDAYESVQAYGQIYYPKLFILSEQRGLPSIIIINRRDVMPTISFRKALPEDNDDIVEMIDHEEPELRKQNGDFYIAEELLASERTGQNELIVVAELADSIAGLMWLTDKLDVELLAKNFHLDRLGNLTRCTPGAKHGRVTFEVISAHTKPYKDLYSESVLIGKQKTSMGSATTMSSIMFTNNPLEPDFQLRHSHLLTSRYKSIYDDLRKGHYYINAEPEILEIAFDLPNDEEHYDKANAVQYFRRASSAFLLKMFNLNPKVRIEFTFFYLSAMFSAFPELDYCVLRVPHTSTGSKSLRELIRFFLRTAHRPNSTVSDSLFVAHRCTLFGDLHIFPLKKSELDEITTLLRLPSPSKETVYPDGDQESGISWTVSTQIPPEGCQIIDQIFSDIFSNAETEFTCYTIHCGNSKSRTIVGFIVLRPFTDYDALSKKFFLPRDEFFLTYRRGEIVIFKLHPLFHIWCDIIVRSAAIQDNYRELYYFHQFMGLSLPNDLMYNMMPVEPRRVTRNWFPQNDTEGVKRQIDTVNFPKINFISDHLHVVCHNLLPSKPMGIPSPLVIVGFSDICRAFLRHIIFGWNSKDFANFKRYNCLPMVDITVIVPHGVVEAAYDSDFSCSYCQGNKLCYVSIGSSCPFVKDATHRMDLRHWVQFVPGNLESIDRTEKVIRLSDSCNIRYERLLLLNDIRYGLKDEDTTVAMPHNYSVINYRLDKVILYHKLQNLFENDYLCTPIIIYGYSLAVYECINFLVTHGCQPNDITYVQPHIPVVSEQILYPREDAGLDPILIEMVADLGIEIYLSANFSRLIFFPNKANIESVEFQLIPSQKLIVLNCDIFINFNESFMCSGFERILLASGIELSNKKIIVNNDYCTNDPNIYAIGQYITMVPSPNYQYTHTNPQECAEKLAFVLNMQAGSTQQRFSKVNIFTGRLPLDYQVVKIVAPQPLLKAQLSTEYMESMTTYQDGDFCRVRVNPKMIVMEIVCVTKKKKSLLFLEYFCGRHVALLNNMRDRWKSGWIENFLEYFEQPWTELIMHERFQDLQLKNRRSLLAILMMDTNTNLRDADNRHSLEEAQRMKLENNLIEFVRTYRKEFVNEFALPEEFNAPTW